MASAGLLALLDDIATILDDVSVLTKITAKKAAGVLGDDLALNAEQVTGVRAERELPIVWAVAKGSARNKSILVPAALLLSAFIPWMITPLLMLGGAYLCYEGFEKIAEKLWHAEDIEQHKHQLKAGLADPDFDLAAFEQDKIKGAIRTDFILSAEIIVIALGIVQGSDLPQQILTLIVVAIAMTVGVYGLVAAIVKLDDLGLYCMQSQRQVVRYVGRGILAACPVLMKFLSIAGTAAMFLVGGGILVHSIPVAHHALEYISHLPLVDGFPMFVTSGIFNAIVGIIVGAAIVAMAILGKRVRGART